MLRDKNFPSIVTWSLGNESGYVVWGGAVRVWCRLCVRERACVSSDCCGSAENLHGRGGGGLVQGQWKPPPGNLVLSIHRTRAHVPTPHTHTHTHTHTHSHRYGCNFDVCKAWMKEYDPTRPVQYEGGLKGGDLSLIHI